ncbi:MAG: hypothetical protein ACYTBJ_25990 [Planctomycetota bacterium]|jgi:hypothetical protein
MADRRYALLGHTHAGGGSGVAWGGITGTLSAQTDLQSALDAKAATSHTHVAANINAESSTDGWVLTSDGAGNAAWEAVPAGGGEINDLTAAVTWANVPIANVPTGTTGSTVALGNHLHTGVYEPADATILKDVDIGVTVAAFAHNHSGVYEPVDSTILRNGDPQEYIVIQDTKAGSNEENWVIENEIGPFKISTATDAAPSTPSTNVITLNRVGTSPAGITLNAAVTITGSCSVTGAVTGSNLNVSNWDTAFGWGDWSGHNHSGVYEPADATIVKDADIGVTVQGYNVDTLFADVADTISALHQYSSNPRRLSQGGMLHHNSSSYTDGGVTFSTSSASAGTTGDIWFTYT